MELDENATEPPALRGSLRIIEEYMRRMDEMGILDDATIIVTADHGCDPVYPTTDHTREYVPLLVWGLGIEEGVNLGVRDTFADVAKTALDALGVKNDLPGKSFYADLNPAD